MNQRTKKHTPPLAISDPFCFISSLHLYSTRFSHAPLQILTCPITRPRGTSNPGRWTSIFITSLSLTASFYPIHPPTIRPPPPPPLAPPPSTDITPLAHNSALNAHQSNHPLHVYAPIAHLPCPAPSSVSKCPTPSNFEHDVMYTAGITHPPLC